MSGWTIRLRFLSCWCTSVVGPLRAEVKDVLDVLREDFRERTERQDGIDIRPLLRHLEDGVSRVVDVLVLYLSGRLIDDRRVFVSKFGLAAALLVEAHPPAAVFGLAFDDRWLAALRTGPLAFAIAVLRLHRRAGADAQSDFGARHA